MQILAPEEVTALVTAFRGRSLYAPVVMALASGARRGELLALRWSDVHIEQGTVRFWRSLEDTKAGLRIKETKTSSGRRVIGIPVEVAAELRAHRRAQLELTLQLGQGRPADDAFLVFGTWDGQLRKFREPRPRSSAGSPRRRNCRSRFTRCAIVTRAASSPAISTW